MILATTSTGAKVFEYGTEGSYVDPWGYAVDPDDHKPKYIPFTGKTFPKGEVWFRHNDWGDDGTRVQVQAVMSHSILVSDINSSEFDPMILFDVLLEIGEISVDGGKTWQVAGELED